MSSDRYKPETIGDKWVVKSKWMLQTIRLDFKGLAAQTGVDQLIIRLLGNRGYREAEEIRAFFGDDLSMLSDPLLLKDVRKGAQLVAGKLAEGKKIRIIGDYDVDGITASCILKKLFSLEGEAGSISIDIPDRHQDGYGLNERLIRKALEDGVDTIVTCDNGIAATDAVRLAKDNGMTVVITDHHEVPYEESDGEAGTRRMLLPEADAVIDPKRMDDTYPQKGICGAMVALKFCQVLLDFDNTKLEEAASGRRDDPMSRTFRECIEIAALGTVVDVMELKGENRLLVKKGLRLMNDSANPGLRALTRIKDLQKELKAYHMSFVIGPCLNASGRLDSAMKGARLLMAETDAEAMELAVELDTLNEERKKLQNDGIMEACSFLEKEDTPADPVIVIYLPKLEESIAGLVAGKLKERYHRPSLVITDSAEEGVVKGSGRSIEAYHLYEGLHGVEDLLLKYGGHAAAAGFSLKKENLEVFRQRLNENCHLTTEDLAEKVKIDADMPFSYISRQLIKQIDTLEPYGVGNPKPVFGLLHVRCEGEVMIYGAGRDVAKCTLVDEKGGRIQAVYFGPAQAFREAVKREGGANILYEAGINVFRGEESLQVIVREYQ
ncbi:MAG: single-stranded-DNA-specific exonuclease RecJ [Lachnospiraceae bacterium]|nr:single-stranded-DNA-specific exonuclease RecJ [Lachnospiraceae bacterium]